MSSINPSQSTLTPRGTSFPLKDALLARFPFVRAAFNQTTFIESLDLPAQVLADIWLPIGFPPVSFEALSEEEEKISQTGQFANTNTRLRNASHNSPGNSSNYVSAPSGGEYRMNNSRQPRQGQGHGQGQGQGHGQGQGNRTRTPGYTGTNNRGNYGRLHQSDDNINHHNHEDDVIEDPDSLWATPSSDTFGSTDFGSFDENGMFRAAGTGSKALEEDAGFDSFITNRQSHMVPKPAASIAPVVQPVSPTAVAIPLITPDTQWLYRDPSGQIQGPFPSHRMIEWYNGKYFPENLPLRREQDAFFEPLSTWKTKCAGKVPFIAFTEAKAPEQPIVTEQPLVAPSSQWFAEPEPSSVNKPSSTARSVPIESFFSASKATNPEPISPIEKPSSPEVMMPTWKKLDKPSVTAKFGQMSLNSTESPAKTSGAVVESTTPTATVVTKPAIQASELSSSTAPSSATWSTASIAGSSSSLKKISLSDILKSNEEPNIVLHEREPLQLPISNPSPVGWAKLSSSPVQSLSSIQAEEAARKKSIPTAASAVAAVPIVTASSASKSFADLVRSAGVIEGNIVVSPITANTEQHVQLRMEKKQPTTPIPTIPTTIPTTTTHVTKTTTPQSIEDWCLSTLNQSSSPFSKSIDPQTCTILLMDLPNPSALLTFALETLKPLETPGTTFDLATFAHDFSLKKFGQKATDKVQWSKLKNFPQIPKQEESFEVVKRKK